MLELHIRRLVLGAVAFAGAAALTASQASAQIPQPPSTVFGSVTDDAGPIDEGLRVEAYIGDILCGEGETGLTGDGDARVTVYYADVVSEQQLEGCGASGKEVTLRIGDRSATQTFLWEPGPVHLDVTFGNATPAPIPTRTPTPRPTEPSETATEEPNEAETVETIPPGSPGAGSPVATSRGGVTSSDVGPGGGSGGDGDGGGGFPIWAAAVFLLGGLAVVGGGVGFAMSRNRQEDDDDLFPRPSLD
jgi:hypothetical protein